MHTRCRHTVTLQIIMQVASGQVFENTLCIQKFRSEYMYMCSEDRKRWKKKKNSADVDGAPMSSSGAKLQLYSDRMQETKLRAILFPDLLNIRIYKESIIQFECGQICIIIMVSKLQEDC